MEKWFHLRRTFPIFSVFPMISCLSLIYDRYSVIVIGIWHSLCSYRYFNLYRIHISIILLLPPLLFGFIFRKLMTFPHPPRYSCHTSNNKLLHIKFMENLYSLKLALNFKTYP